MSPTTTKKKVLRKTFKDLGLQKTTLDALDAIGFEHPTPIQAKTIQRLLDGRDVIGQARTGTGKTAAFGLPIIENLDYDAEHVQALILAPTRELAVQIDHEINNYGANRPLRTICIYGGTGYDEQDNALEEGVHIVVGTPGRIMDHMERGTLDLTKTKIMVLDEADRMLDMGFIEDIEWILRHMPGKHDRQTLLFSATMPEEIRSLCRRFMRQADFVRVSADEITVPEIDQIYYPVSRRNKLWALTRVLDNDADAIDLMIVFCATKHMCDRLQGDLKQQGFSAEALHGDLPQSKREQVLKRFDQGKTKILIATDVAARGLDIDNITHVVNWDLPEQEPENYVHRIGRTGRAGRSGIAISFVGLDDKNTLKRIEMMIGREIQEGLPPEPKKGKKDRINRVIDWDELSDMYGRVHIEANLGRSHGVTPFKLHHMIQKATGLPDHAIQILDFEDDRSRVAVPKDTAMRARNGLSRQKGFKHDLDVAFESHGTTVRSA